MRTPRSRTAALAFFLLAVASSLSGCAHSPDSLMKVGTLSPTLAPFIYKEEGDLVLMTVSVGATRMRDDQPFVPIEVWVANKGVSPYISLDRESFFLMDTFGHRYGMAGVEEVRKLQGGVSLDRRLGSPEFNSFKFEAYHFVDSAFFPLLGAEVVHDRVELPRYGFMRDILYFPRPEGDLLGGVFELHMMAKQLTQEIFVVFEVPRA